METLWIMRHYAIWGPHNKYKIFVAGNLNLNLKYFIFVWGTLNRTDVELFKMFPICSSRVVIYHTSHPAQEGYKILLYFVLYCWSKPSLLAWRHKVHSSVNKEQQSIPEVIIFETIDDLHGKIISYMDVWIETHVLFLLPVNDC